MMINDEKVMQDDGVKMMDDDKEMVVGRRASVRRWNKDERGC